MLTGGMLATMSEPSIVIDGIAGIGTAQTDRAANGNTNSTTVNAMDTSLNRHVIRFCNRILTSHDDVFCDCRHRDP
jgi:hypothetical protein